MHTESDFNQIFSTAVQSRHHNQTKTHSKDSEEETRHQKKNKADIYSGLGKKHISRSSLGNTTNQWNDSGQGARLS